MVSEIRIYVEGGGQGKDTKARIREGFRGFLRDVIVLARDKRIKWTIIACGARNNAFDDFVTALDVHPDAFNMLLVDAEGPVQGQPWNHLRHRDGWNIPALPDEHCHLMVQIMEAWLIADGDALRRFYGHGFNANAIPRTANIEQVGKDALERALHDATRHTKQGEYHNIWHGAELLKRVDVSRVRSVMSYCDRLFVTLQEKIDEAVY